MQDVDEIIKEYSNHIYKYLLYLTHNYDIAEELTQETMYKAIINFNQLKNRDKVEMWLCRIAKNLWFQELNKRKRYTVIENKDLEKIPISNEMEENLIQKDYKNKIYSKIEKLDEIEQQIIYLRLNADLKFKEIGEMFGKNENWARVSFYRAKQQIVKEVKRDDEKDRV